LGVEAIHNRAWNRRAQLSQTIVLVLDVLEEITRLHALLTRQTQFDVDETIELGVVDRRHAVTLRPLSPAEVRTNRIQNTNHERGDTQRGRSKLGITREQTGRAGVQEGNRTRAHNDGKVNVDLATSEDALCALVHDRKTVCLLACLGKVVL